MHAIARTLFVLGAFAPVVPQQRDAPVPPAPTPPGPAVPAPAARPFDAELIGALTAFANATSYRFELAATAPAAWSAATTFELAGCQAEAAPLQLVGGGVEAFRARGQLVFRLPPAGDWRRLRAPARPAEPLASGAPPLTLLPYFARVLAPHQLLERSVERLQQATRVESGAPPGTSAFDCVLLSVRDPRLAGVAVPLRLRLVLRGGALEGLSVVPAANFAFDAPALSTPAAAELLDFTLHYVVREIGASTVEVPAAVQRLLAE
ncbi:MAG: hypothetical protein JNL90_14885 [Planctomycetes bacterium]|nr:hypothetical protein [Planctomycetota bacterium]